MEEHKLQLKRLKEEDAIDNGDSDFDKESDEEWEGIEEPPAVDYEAEYIDEDKYTTVTVEEIDSSREGLRKSILGEDDDEEEAKAKAKAEEAAKKAEEEAETARKRKERVTSPRRRRSSSGTKASRIANSPRLSSACQRQRKPRHGGRNEEMAS